jgi:hypothetical protein
MAGVRPAAFAVTVTVLGVVDVEAVAVSQGESVATVNGTGLPFPTAVSWNVWEAEGCADPVVAARLIDLDDSCKSGPKVTTRVTGIGVLLVELSTVTVVV